MCRASLAAEPTTPLFDSRSAPAQRTQSCGTSLSIEGADARGSTAIAPARSTNTTLPRVETTCPSWGSVLACRTVTVRMLGVGFNTTFARLRITIVWHGTVRALCVRRRTEERAQHRHEERRPETKIITLESRNSGKRLLLLSLTTSVTRLGDF